MSRRRRRWALVFWLLLGGAGCATEPFPVHPAMERSALRPPAPLAAAAAPLALPPVVAENQTFVTINGVPWYRIGPGDVLEILLTREFAQERVSAVVRANGRVTIGFFDATVAGLTTDQAEREIQRVLAPTNKQLTVEVTVKEYASKTVSILGEVQKIGRVPLRGRTNLLELLAEAGGPTGNADLGAIRLLRQTGATYTINLFGLFAEGQRFRDLVLDEGDVVFVPRRTAEEQTKVFVLGEVKSPGAFTYTPNLRLSQLLAMAGGPTPAAVLESARVIRGDLQRPQIVDVWAGGFTTTLERSQDIVLQGNDLVVVPRNRIGDWNAFLAQVRPTLEFLTLPLQPVAEYLLLQQLVK